MSHVLALVMDALVLIVFACMWREFIKLIRMTESAQNRIDQCIQEITRINNTIESITDTVVKTK